ncbi:MAG: hypothetical protein ACI9DJ_003246, partial [Algoriphagus sp.]
NQMARIVFFEIIDLKHVRIYNSLITVSEKTLFVVNIMGKWQNLK